MITVELVVDSKEVIITFDENGAALIDEIMRHMRQSHSGDHIHFQAGPNEINGHPQLPESYALSLKKVNKRPDVVVLDSLTLAFAP